MPAAAAALLLSKEPGPAAAAAAAQVRGGGRGPIGPYGAPQPHGNPHFLMGTLFGDPPHPCQGVSGPCGPFPCGLRGCWGVMGSLGPWFRSLGGCWGLGSPQTCVPPVCGVAEPCVLFPGGVLGFGARLYMCLPLPVYRGYGVTEPCVPFPGGVLGFGVTPDVCPPHT